MGKNILIVDDSMSIRQTLGMVLKSEGYSVVEAIDGKDAMSKLDGTRFNLIISDVNMPNMDGIEFVKSVKQTPHYKFIPIIMLTTEGNESKKNEGRNAGVKAWIVKPFQPPTLLEAINKLIA